MATFLKASIEKIWDSNTVRKELINHVTKEENRIARGSGERRRRVRGRQDEEEEEERVVFCEKCENHGEECGAAEDKTPTRCPTRPTPSNTLLCVASASCKEGEKIDHFIHSKITLVISPSHVHAHPRVQSDLIFLSPYPRPFPLPQSSPSLSSN